MPWKEDEEPGANEVCPNCGKPALPGNAIVQVKDGMYYRAHVNCKTPAVSPGDKTAKR